MDNITGALLNPNDVNANYIFIPYSLVVISNQIGANGGTITPATLDQDGDFELHYIQGSSTLDDPAKIFNNNFSCLITDKSNSRIWGSDRVPQKNLSGPENQGLPERRPVLLARKTNLSFDILNLTGNAIVVTMVLKGYKVRKP